MSFEQSAIIQKLPESSKGNLASLRYLLGYFKPYWFSVLVAIIALIATSTTFLALGVGIRHLVDQGFASHDPTSLYQAVSYILILAGVLAFATFIRFYSVNYLGERIIADLRYRVYHHLVHLSPAFFESKRTGDLISRLATDTTLLQTVVGGGVSIALRNCILLVGGTAMLLITNAKLFAVIALIVPLTIGVILGFGRYVKKLSVKTQDCIADATAHLEETFYGIRTVQAYRREPHELRLFSNHAKQVFSASMKRVIYRGVLVGVVIFSVFAFIALVLLIGGHDVLAGHMSEGELASFVFYAVVVAGSLAAISETMSDLQRAAGSVERLLEILDYVSPINDPTCPVLLANPYRLAITFHGVSFEYPLRPGQQTLAECSFTIYPKQTTAIVGASGSGKSTLCQLLMRFYDPHTGVITINGVDIRKLPLTQLRGMISYVLQDPAIFSADAFENIAYGCPNATLEDVKRAATLACADTFIEALPDGYHTYLGEKGVKLSGGQKQRIAIARAILKPSRILLLDEAMSQLDAPLEARVLKNLQSAMHDKTILLISHRLSTIQQADQIIVVKDGRMVECGTDADLMKQNKVYAQLAKKQSRPVLQESELA